MKKKTKEVVIIILLIIASFIGGYTFGYTSALNWGVEKAMIFYERAGYNISESYNMIGRGIWQYKNNVNGCLFAGEEDALILNNSRN